MDSFPRFDPSLVLAEWGEASKKHHSLQTFIKFQWICYKINECFYLLIVTLGQKLHNDVASGCHA